MRRLRYIDAIGQYDDLALRIPHTFDKEQLITRLAVEHTITDTLRTQAGISYFDLERAEHSAFGVSDFFNDTRSYDWNLTAQPNAKSTLLKR